MKIRAIKNIFNQAFKTIIYVSICTFFYYCTNKSETGYYFAPDMFEAKHIAPYSGADTITKKHKSYPKDYEPYLLQKTTAQRKLSGKIYSAPNTLKDSTYYSKAKNLYQNHCAMCHGEKGDGKGILFTEGKYTYPPANLLQDKITEMPDYEIYHVISAGFDLMKGMPHQISPYNRWLIVDYSKSLKYKQ